MLIAERNITGRIQDGAKVKENSDGAGWDKT